LSTVQDFVGRAQSTAGVRQLFLSYLKNCLSLSPRDGLPPLHVLPTTTAFKPVEGMIHHRDFEFLIQLIGTSCWHHAEGCEKVAPGELLLIPSGVAHREDHNIGKSASCNLNVYVMRDGVAFHANVYPRPEDWTFLACWAGSGGWHSTLYNSLAGAVVAHTVGAKSSKAAMEGLLVAFLTGLQDCIITCQDVPYSSTHLVERCRKQLINNLSSPSLSVAFLAKRLGCSADYLSNCYSRQIGKTITQTINAERLALAQELLRISAMNISEIAVACGYADPGYFGRLFKRLVGITPRAYRHSRSGQHVL
jgi:AraC-like DNA-binding protein